MKLEVKIENNKIYAITSKDKFLSMLYILTYNMGFCNMLI